MYDKDGASEQQEYYDYLEDLRQDGSVNMYGAAPYLARDFGLSKREAREVLGEWMAAYRTTKE